MSTIILTSIKWDEIQPIWQNFLWPKRNSAIDPNSAMVFNQPDTYEIGNMHTTPTFIAVTYGGSILGVNSGHACTDGGYRSRGLWVHDQLRGCGYGKRLLLSTIDQARKEGCTYCWSFPRKSSWHAYQAAGFELVSDWMSSETSEANAYCRIDLT